MTKIDLRNTLLLSLVFILVAVFGFWLPNRVTQQPSASSGSSGHAEVKVKYTDQGFVPKTVTVTVGTTVAWSSPSGRPMWVASDPHPSHTDLKGFDEKGVITKAKTASPFVGTAYAHGTGVYEYTFMKVGSWKYHNHVNPQDRGTVIVTKK